MTKTTGLLMTILIIASFLRLYNLIPVNNVGLPPGLYPDEAMNGNNALEALENRSWKVFYPENFGREGLFINIQSFFVAIFGHKAWVLRLPSAIFGVLTVLGLYFLTKTLISGKNSEAIALLASFFLATSFWHINFSHIGFRAIMAPFFLVWALYFLLKSFEGKRFSFYALAAGLFYGLGFYSYIAYRVTPLLILILGVIYWKNYGPSFKKHLARVFGLFAVSAIITALPLGLYFAKNPEDFFGRTSGISVFNSSLPLRDFSLNVLKTAGMFNAVGDFNWRHNIAGRPELFLPVGALFIAGFYLSIKKIFSKKLQADREIIILSWLVLAFLPVAISNEGLPHALRSLLMVPPVFILSAIGGLETYKLLNQKINRRLLLPGVYLFLSLLVYESYYSYFITWGENQNVKNAFSYNDSVIAGELNSLPRNLPKYVIVNGARGEIRRDYPISLQSVLFLTDTFSDLKRKEKNIFYVSTEFVGQIPKNSYVVSI